MPIEIRVPELSESAAYATLLQWQFPIGSKVELDQILVEVETDKVVLELTAPASGILSKIFVAGGDDVTSGQILAIIDDQIQVDAKVTSPPVASTPELSRRTGRIFLSYRREDSIDISDRMFEEITRNFGADSVFKDIDSIPLGVDFRSHLLEELQGCAIMLVVIGRAWLTATDEAANRRLDSEYDFVRLEIENALSRSIPVIPVLVGGATLPPSAHLPESLRPLAYRQGTSVRSGPHFRSDMEVLVRSLQRLRLQKDEG